MKENIILGDLHGSRNEFNQLLEKIKYNKNLHRLILVGDIIDRGPDPVGLLHQIQDMGIESTFANHEEKCLRWRRHEALKELTGKDNPMKEVSPERRREWLALSKDDLHWMSNLPLKIHIKDNWYVVHAGLEPAVAFDKQDVSKIIRIRYVDKHGLMVKPKSKEKPADTYFWAERWEQEFNIVFGHQRFDEPKIFKNSNNVCIGIDTGCVFGNALTAYNLERNKFIQVKSNKVYYKRESK